MESTAHPPSPDLSQTASGSASTAASSPEQSAGPSQHSGSLDRVRRKPIPRKGHTKSRRGCLNCKRRKVKCQETLPECEHCRRIGLPCEYPKSTYESLVVAPRPALQSTPTVFNMQDMRLFQHFILNAYPPMPLKGGQVWKNVAAMAHEYDFLIHAMLGMSASHLALSTGDDFSQQALAHRVAALNSINRILNEPCSTTAEVDARIVTLVVLGYQSAYMNEGMLDFLSMIRGCVLVAEENWRLLEKSLLSPYSFDGRVIMARAFADGLRLDMADEQVVDEFLYSIRAILPICKLEIEIRFMVALEKLAEAGRLSTAEGFVQFWEFYMIIGKSDPDDYKAFMDPGNHTAQILLAHFVLIECIIGSLVLQPAVDLYSFRKTITLAWIRRVADGLPSRYKPYIRWPLQFAESAFSSDRQQPAMLLT